MHVSPLIFQKEPSTQKSLHGPAGLWDAKTTFLVVDMLVKGLNALLNFLPVKEVTFLNHIFYRGTTAENHIKQVCIIHKQAHTLHGQNFYLLHVS